ncbi:glycosyltransferase family 64 protein [Mixia osmundae IAM 14324]|uniref:glycosyltransferase family 64 protein n=1 Tax=Mixia osmundae (strain CBS 9802 / IAM 14324 / JCM 22182 / KY 12970) TaxID=764103 RepID=UPI0004A54CE3|nr:glycosyltransferase family 64 protein [Mixia osmundae IAM 14324]KEI39460.1 glycosyltransferase family 64 protein [Mixia osmundae IAM 14324]
MLDKAAIRAARDANLAACRMPRLRLILFALCATLWTLWQVPAVRDQLNTTERLQSLQASYRRLAARSDIHIALTLDSDDVIGSLALINSTIQRGSSDTRSRLQWHIISTSQESSETLRRLLRTRFNGIRLQTYTISPNMVPLPAQLQAGHRNNSDVEPIVDARYMFGQLFPDFDRVIYLDQDTLVLKDIGRLWRQDMSGRPLAGAELCRDAALFRKQSDMRENLLDGFHRDRCTLNDGVLLYDLTQWRDGRFASELCGWISTETNTKLDSLGSHAPFNSVFYRNYEVLDDSYNLMDLAGLKDDEGLPITRSAQDVEDAVVLHWNGIFKPWMCTIYYSELWQQFVPDYTSFVGLDVTSQESYARVCTEGIWTSDESLSHHEEQFTVVIVSHAREDNLMRIAHHLRESNLIRDIIIAWNNQDHPCPASLQHLAICVQQESNLVHNRFKVWQHVVTDAVLHYDDDIIIPLADLEAGFRIWRRHRDQLLGFEPRVIDCADPNDMESCHYRFQMRQAHFDLVIGKAFFTHVRYMEDYSSSNVLMNLTKKTPCEDLAMNFLAGSLSHKPPLWMKSNITEITSTMFTGLSQGIKSAIWRDARHDCIRQLHAIFGKRTVWPQRSKFQRHPTLSDRILKLQIPPGDSWCSDKDGARSGLAIRAAQSKLARLLRQSRRVLSGLLAMLDSPAAIRKARDAVPAACRMPKLRLALFALCATVWALMQIPAVHDQLADQLTAPERLRPLQASYRRLAARSDINIALTLDSDYVIGSLALINSTIQTASSDTRSRLQWHIVSTSQESSERLRRLLRTRFRGIRLKTYTIPPDLVPSTTKVWAGYRSDSLSKPIVYARYIFGQLFPDFDRVIYLDQDTLVLKDIGRLWRQDMSGRPVAGVRLCRDAALFRKQFVMRENVLDGFDHDECTLNNGVLLYDLTQWRDGRFAKELFGWTSANADTKLYSLGSQPPFNLVFYRNYKVLDDSYNLMDLAGLKDDRKVPITRSAQDVQNAVVLHWNGVFKPWMCKMYWAELWQQYLPDYEHYLPHDPKTLDGYLKTCDDGVVTEGHQVSREQSGFTAIISTRGKADSILKILRTLRHSTFLRDVIVIWNNPNKECPASLGTVTQCIQGTSDGSISWHQAWPYINTKTALLLNDETIVLTSDLDAAFQTWSAFPDQLLGFEPRVLACEQNSCESSRLLSDGQLNHLSSNAIFTHVRYLEEFSRAFGQNKALDASCTDLAFSWLVSYLSAKPPLYFKANLTLTSSSARPDRASPVPSAVTSCTYDLRHRFGRDSLQNATAYHHFDRITQQITKSSIPLSDCVAYDRHGPQDPTTCLH